MMTAKEALIALRDGIDLPIHSEPIPEDSSWRYLVDQGLKAPEDYNEYPLEELELDTRSYTCLRRHGVESVGDLLRMSAQDLLLVKNFGLRSLASVREVLGSVNLYLKGESSRKSSQTI